MKECISPTSPTTLDLAWGSRQVLLQRRPSLASPMATKLPRDEAASAQSPPRTAPSTTIRSRSRALDLDFEPTMQLPPLTSRTFSQLPQLVPLASLQPPSESAASPPPQRRQRQRLQPERILPAQWSLKASSPRWWKMPAHVADSCNNFDTSHRKFLGEACVRLADVNQARGSKSAVLRDHQWQQSHFELRWNRYHSQVR